MKNIGPTFADELKAAGLLGLPFAWCADGSITYSEAITEDQSIAIAAVYAAHDPGTVSATQQLAQLDAANTLTQRNLRETVMLMAEAFKTISGGALDLSTIPGVAKVFEVEAQAEALRAQL